MERPVRHGRSEDRQEELKKPFGDRPGRTWSARCGAASRFLALLPQRNGYRAELIYRANSREKMIGGVNPLGQRRRPSQAGIRTVTSHPGQFMNGRTSDFQSSPWPWWRTSASPTVRPHLGARLCEGKRRPDDPQGREYGHGGPQFSPIAERTCTVGGADITAANNCRKPSSRVKPRSATRRSRWWTDYDAAPGSRPLTVEMIVATDENAKKAQQIIAGRDALPFSRTCDWRVGVKLQITV